MQIHKPLSLGLSCRQLEHRRKYGSCISALLHIPLGPQTQGKAALWSEQSLWDFLGKEASAPLIDEGIAKTTSEFMVHGYAYPNPAPSDRSKAVAVRARLGSIRKTVLAFGNRYWDGDKISEPLPFERIPLDWRHAYGGPDFAANLEGMGREWQDGLCRIPNLELRSSRMTKPDDVLTPAGFGPLEIMHPQRRALGGTYDENWLRDHSPGAAPDLKWQHYNQAPRDQWFDQPLIGDEPFELENMHPTRPLIEGRLPGLRARVFAQIKHPSVKAEGNTEDEGDGAAAAVEFREVAMQLSTVWFFPHAERIILVFHGLLPVQTDDASEVTDLLAAVERIGEPKSDEHYVEVLRKRTEGPDADLESLNDEDLLPAGIETDDVLSQMAKDADQRGGLRAQAQLRRAQVDALIGRDKLKAAGKDPEQLKIPKREPMPKPSELVEVVRKARKEGEAAQVQALEKALDQVIAALDFQRKHKIGPAKRVHRGPPKYSADEEIAKLEAIYNKANKPFDRATVEPKLRQLQEVHRANYLKVAHEQAPAFPLSGDEGRLRRAEMEFVVEKGLKFLPQFDLTGVDLSNLDLRGIDFRGAWLESANLDGANITRCDFSAAVLAHASLRGTIAVGTKFVGANLGQATLVDALMSEADFRKAMMMKVRLRGCDLSEATLSETLIIESTWDSVDFSQAHLASMVFHQLDLKNCVFEQATLSSALFNECDLCSADFHEANCAAASFVDCDARGGAFQFANLEAAVFASNTRLMGANFGGANLSRIHVHECDLSGVNLRKATLDKANLSGVTLRASDARLATARGALLSKSDWRQARLVGVDFKDAILKGADLRGADLRYGHFFGADLSRVHLDTNSKTDGMLMEQARIHPRYQPPEALAADMES